MAALMQRWLRWLGNWSPRGARPSALALAIIAVLPGGCDKRPHSPDGPPSNESAIKAPPNGVLDQYLRASNTAERVLIVESVAASTPESRRVLVLAFDSDDPDLKPAAVRTICHRFVEYVPPGGSETQIECAEKWLDANAR